MSTTQSPKIATASPSKTSVPTPGFGPAPPGEGPTGRIRIALLLFLLLHAGSSAQNTSTSQTQDSPTSDPQAVAVLNQALAISGGATAGTESFSASGSITYYWAGKEVKGSVLVRNRGTDQFRLDAVPPDGTRSWAVSRGKGSVKEADCKSTAIHYFNALNDGALTNPLARVAALLNEGGVQIPTLGWNRWKGARLTMFSCNPAPSRRTTQDEMSLG